MAQKKVRIPKLYREDYKIGAPPGTVSTAASTPITQAVITLIDYNQQIFQERKLQSVEECYPFKETNTVSWINIDGNDPQIISKIQAHFGVHPLVLEDILSTGQQPKAEDYDDYMFFVLRLIDFDAQKNEITSEQISLILGKTYVISFQENVGDIFDPIRDRIRHAKGRVRNMGPDYLAYSLIDGIVDNYFVILDKLGQRIDELEGRLMTTNVDQKLPYEVHNLKRQIIFLRKQIWPLRDVVNTITRTTSKLITKSTLVFFRDVYDHTMQVTETIESFRDALSAMHDIYLSTVSHRMNEVMKVLTIFTSIFIPLTFIVGVYGMNFEHMPELQWEWGYELIWGIMILVAGSMIIYFKRQKWF